MRDANAIADKGAAWLERRLIADDFDWTAYDETPERVKVRPASSFADDVVAEFLDDEARSAGALWPWDKANDRGLRIRRQEVTVYAGINGHRKSLLTGQIALSLMAQGEPCLIASFEMPVRKTLRRLVIQSAATQEPSVRYVRSWMRWSDARLWLYDHLGTCEPRKVLAVARYAASELGVRHVFVDSMMKVVANVDDYNGQKRFVGELCALAMAFDAHVHLVAHARKGRDEADRIDKFDVKGVGDIVDLAHNAVLVQKNLRPKDEGEPDQWLTIAKQRDGAFEGTLGLWFDEQALTFSDRARGRWPALDVGMNREGVDDEAALERAALQAPGV